MGILATKEREPLEVARDELNALCDREMKVRAMQQQAADSVEAAVQSRRAAHLAGETKRAAECDRTIVASRETAAGLADALDVLHAQIVEVEKVIAALKERHKRDKEAAAKRDLISRLDGARGKFLESAKAFRSVLNECPASSEGPGLSELLLQFLETEGRAVPPLVHGLHTHAALLANPNTSRKELELHGLRDLQPLEPVPPADTSASDKFLRSVDPLHDVPHSEWPLGMPPNPRPRSVHSPAPFEQSVAQQSAKPKPKPGKANDPVAAAEAALAAATGGQVEDLDRGPGYTLPVAGPME